jgi:peptidoglycan hydrolase-like protein with peptidoglycan-binding domain
MKGDDVKEFQNLVTNRGFSCGTIDGKYGEKSVSACKKFQSSAGLSADGICGPDTWNKLEGRRMLKLTSPLMKGDDVKEFQTKITNHGYNCGSIDSMYGEKAKAACISFQKAKGLSADGICGDKTWAALDGSTSSSGTSGRRLLKKTSPLMKGDDVTEFQNLVKSKGFDPGTIDGKYGDKCVEACKNFQKSAGLSVDGMCGDKTWAALDSDSAPSVGRRLLKKTSPLMQGEDVKEFQTLVKSKGFDPGTIDGKYGDNSIAACKAFQGYAGLSVDGMCGDKTWAALDSDIKPYEPSESAPSEPTTGTEKELRESVVIEAKKYLGYKESDGSHKKIVDIYNSHSPLARGYKVKYTDSWCAVFVSVVSIQCGLTDIMPTECSCGRMIELYQKLGRWEENDAYVPNIGDIIMYDWDDSGKGDNTGWPEHVGIVTEVTGSTMKIIEGNKSDSVAYRTVSVNGKDIRGYCLPDYASKANK